MEMKQAAQVLDLLEFFAGSGQPATLAEVCKQLGWPKSSAFKLLGTLSGRGYLYEPYGRGVYYPSSKWAGLIDAITNSEPIPQALHNLLRTLSEQTGETAVLGSISGLNALFIDAVEPGNPVRYTAEVGKTVPLHVTAIGRALMAQLPVSERAAILNKAAYRRFTPATSMSAQEVESQIAKGVRRGYFEGQGELNEDLGGLAVPLSVPGRPLAVMVAGPLYRIGPRYAEIARQLGQQCNAVEAQLSPEAPAKLAAVG